MRTTVGFLSLGVLAALAACSSTPTQEQSPAGVEDRTPATVARSGPSIPVPPTETRGTQSTPPSGIDLTQRSSPAVTAGDPTKDPRNILSKRSIYYDYDRFDVREEFREMVEAHGKFLRENPSRKILIQGNTDERGGREYNLALGQRRAEAVKRMLVLLGAKEDQVEAVSLGEEKPRAQGADEKAWAENRRSDILYSGEF